MSENTANHRPDTKQSLMDKFRSLWESTPCPSVIDFLHRNPTLNVTDGCRSESLLMPLLIVDLEMRGRCGKLGAPGIVVAEYLRCFPQLTSDERQELARKEQEWINSSQTVISRGPSSCDSIYHKQGSDIPSIQGFTNLVRVGNGSLGAVYSAIQLGTNRKVAIKCIRPELEMDEKARQLFVREASIISRLKHPGIVECLGFGYSESNPYLLMEFVSAEDLEQLVWRHAPHRRVRLAVKVILKVLDALSYSHQAGIVHRDIKPSNILASIVNKRLHLKVADFGLAKLYETAGHSGISGSGEISGTIAYMSPEQLQDSRSAKPECDVYSTLVCLYRLLTMEYPHSGDTLASVFQNRINHEITPPQQFNPEIPEMLAQIILRGLSRKPDLRFRTAQALHNALSELPILK